jgi:ribosomal protein S18 acetylase RimI-like enzyme
MVRNTAPAPRFWLNALTGSAPATDLEGEVDFEEFLVIAALLVVHDVVHQRMDLLVVQRRDVDAAHVAVDADHRRQACGQVQVGRLVLDGKRQQFGDIHDGSPQ